ncbi:MAG TPA: uracil-DNA glycosylase [Bacteroidia bacterium]|jgi:uracil-DNA glycosylase|nr:uracil-DNA glycosylase [Bacteroidia bacterium]
MSTTVAASPQIDETWREALNEEFRKPYFIALKEFLTEEKKQNVVYPPGPLIFSAFNKTPFDQVKVVIIGQDPYHGPGQANGLCFSVSTGIKHPPSLVNIFKEMQKDLNVPYPKTGDLTGWAKQGVLLLNTTLTVRAHTPMSHQGQGWEEFTDSVIRNLSEKRSGIVFILWGRHAQNKKPMIDTSKHHILEAAHPSPFSANGFFGCRHFSKANFLLAQDGTAPVNWIAL